MPILDEYVAMAKRDIGRWYGHRMFFAAPRRVMPTFEEWIKAHWRQFPAADPTGGRIIDGEAAEIVGFLE